MVNKRKLLADRITAALDVAYAYTTDGAHHKQWVIDQMVRELLGNEDNYARWIANYEGPDKDYAWDLGTAPRMTFTEKCEHGRLLVLCSRCFPSRSWRWAPTKSIPTKSQEEQATIPQRQDSPAPPALLSLSRSADATTGPFTVTLLYVQIGVLIYQLSIIVTATGERLMKGSLTFHMPRGRWFQISRWRLGSLTLPLVSVEDQKWKKEVFRSGGNPPIR